MANLSIAKPVACVPRPRILTRPVVALMFISVGALSNFYLLFPVVPIMAIRFGMGTAGAGICAGLLMLCTVLIEPFTPYLTHRFGVRTVLVAGLLLLGVPAIASALLPSSGMLLLSSMLRGIGIGIILVSETALLAAILPPERRGEGIGLYGVIIGIPSLLFLPFGVGVTEAMGPTPIFLVSGGVALLPLIAVHALPHRFVAQSASPLASKTGTAGMIRLVLPFVATTVAIGVVSAFLPIAVVTSGVAMTGLFAQSCTTPLARWIAGRFAARCSTRVLMLVGLFASAAGIAGLFLVGDPAMVVIGMAVFGAGFGVAQYASLTLLLDRGGPGGYNRASAIWNLAYDGGMGIGSGAFGMLANATGFSLGFALTAVVLFGATVAYLLPPRR